MCLYLGCTLRFPHSHGLNLIQYVNIRIWYCTNSWKIWCHHHYYCYHFLCFNLFLRGYIFQSNFILIKLCLSTQDSLRLFNQVGEPNSRCRCWNKMFVLLLGDNLDIRMWWFLGWKLYFFTADGRSRIILRLTCGTNLKMNRTRGLLRELFNLLLRVQKRPTNWFLFLH